MNQDDSFGCDATATGILQCLRMLAEEAAMLRLSRTLDALREAIETCAAERVDPEAAAAGFAAAARIIH
jgi:hypothetical protein